MLGRTQKREWGIEVSREGKKQFGTDNEVQQRVQRLFWGHLVAGLDLGLRRSHEPRSDLVLLLLLALGTGLSPNALPLLCSAVQCIQKDKNAR